MIPDLSIRSNEVTDLNTKFGMVHDAMLNGLVGCYVVVTSPNTAGQPFTIAHSLDVKPVWAIGLDDTGMANLGATDADYNLWTAKSIVMRSANALTKYRVLIVAVN